MFKVNNKDNNAIGVILVSLLLVSLGFKFETLYSPF